MIRANRLTGKQCVQLIVFEVLFFCAVPSMAAPTITSVDPTFGKVGQNLEIAVQGTGFDSGTRLAILPDNGNRLSIIGSILIPGSAGAVAVICTTAYIAAQSGGLQVLDISSLENPIILGSLAPDEFESVNDLAVVGTTAYLADTSGLLVVDVSDPAGLKTVGSMPLADRAWGIAVAGTKAYITDGLHLYVIDVQDGTAPKVIGSLRVLDGAQDVAVSNGIAFVASSQKLLSVDISQPAVPVIIDSIQLPGPVKSLTVANNIAYAVSNGLQLIDVSSPENLSLLGTVSTITGAAGDVVIDGSIAYLADDYKGLQVIDVSNPSNPLLTGSIQTPGYARGVFIANNIAYIGAWTEGLQIVDVRGPFSETFVRTDTTLGLAKDVTIVNNLAYVADGNSGIGDFYNRFRIFDITDPHQPRLSGEIDLPCDIESIEIVGPTCYAACGDRLQLISVGDPAHPTIGASVPILYARDVAVVNDRAYVTGGGDATGGGGLQVIDVDPRSPDYLAIIGSVSTPGWHIGVAEANGYAYVADGAWGGLQIIDVNPLRPTTYLTVVDSVPVPGWPRDVTIANNLAYVTGDGELTIVDISDPLNPAIKSVFSLLNNTANYTAGNVATVRNNIVYFADGKDLNVIDASNPGAPLLIGTVYTPGGACGVDLVNNIAFVADGATGLIVVPAATESLSISLESVTQLNATLPSPFLVGHYTLRIFDSSGSAELPGAVTFMDALPKSKAVIVAGYGPHSSNKLWEETLVNANHAWNVLFAQGYAQENIRYLSPVTVDANSDGTPDVNGDATLAELESTLTTWAADADDLIFYLVGHGSNESFVLKHTSLVHEELPADALAGWLDNLQAAREMRAVGVYEACYSGSFVDAMQLDEDASFARMLLTSSTASQVSILGNKGLTSFSHRFWESLYEQGELIQAFSEASDLMAGFGQTPWLDANCDGLPNTLADSAQKTTVGRGYNFQSPLKPVISCLPPDQDLKNTHSAVLWTRTVSAHPISRVWAEIIPPGYNPSASDATSLPTVELNWSSSRRRYEGKYLQFYEHGTYYVAIYAMDNQQIVSLPRISRITVPPFSWNLFLPALIGNGNGL